ncbi:MAG: FecR domain-containing protein [Niastella sp.]|nr:FecR domain-containing protein [Niastella sp.]
MDIQNYTVEDFICDNSFQHYCLGDDAEAVQYWTNWIRNNPHKQELIQEARRVISILNAKQGNLQEQVGQLKDGIDRFDMLKQALQQDTPAPVRSVRSRFKYVAAIAASILVLVVAGYFLLRPGKTTQQPEQVVTTTTSHKHPVLSSGNEPRKTVVLPDGTVVTLRSNSSITLADNFNTSNRELNLTGEAFFDVTHDKQRPFIVHTNAINIEVLGTVFNVRAYPSNPHTETALFRGKVAVTVKDHPGKPVILTPNMKLVFTHTGGASTTTTANPVRIEPMTVDPSDHKAKEIAWVRNRLKIEDEPLSAIAAKLQTWYGIEISFADEKVKTYRYSGTFESETIIKALEALQLSYPFNFQVEKEKIIISQ